VAVSLRGAALGLLPTDYFGNGAWSLHVRGNQDEAQQPAIE